MSESAETPKAPDTSLAKGVTDLALYHLWRAAGRARPYLGGRRGLIVLAVAALAIGGALNWSWLIAIGVAPLLIALAPCAAMCALGLCMLRKRGGACATEGEAAPTAAARRTAGDTRPEASPRTHPLQARTAGVTRGRSSPRTRPRRAEAVTEAPRLDRAADPAAPTAAIPVAGDGATKTTGEKS